MQIQTSNTLHNAIMEAGSKDRPPMLAPDKRIPNSDRNLTTTTERVFETYKNVTQDIGDQLNAEAEAVHIILTGIENDIYSTVDACPNAIDNNIYSTVDACPNACEVWKAIERLKQDNSPQIHRNAGYEGQRSGTVAGARDTVGSSMVQKYGIQCYNCKEYGHVARECQKPKRAKDPAYHREKMLLYDVDSRPIFDKEPEQKVQNDDHYDVFAIDCQHSEQESAHNTYLLEQDAQNVSIESVDMNYDSEQTDQNDEDVDLAKEHELLASLIAKLKCEIDASKNHNTLLETSNKVLVEKLKSEIADFKNKNKSLTEANNKLSEVNTHLYTDYKKSKAELQRRNTIEYATEIELECAK
nr:hypothetical protein [Tanacetum cinerariifolium]